MDEKEVRGYVVKGRVQGVGFRWFTQRAGCAMKLGGHVRNLPDGSVEVHVSGNPSTLDRFEETLRSGPPASRVEAIERVDADPRTPDDVFLLERW